MTRPAFSGPPGALSARSSADWRFRGGLDLRPSLSAQIDGRLALGDLGTQEVSSLLAFLDALNAEVVAEGNETAP